MLCCLPSWLQIDFVLKLQPCKLAVNCVVYVAVGAIILPVPGRLTAAGLCQTVAALQPPGTIVVDESLTSGTAYWEAAKVGSHNSLLPALAEKLHTAADYCTGSSMAWCART